jgi:signal transduction histidine kinase
MAADQVVSEVLRARTRGKMNSLPPFAKSPPHQPARQRTRTPRFWPLAAQSLGASLAVVSLTVVCYQLHFNVATTALLFVIVVVLVSRVWTFVSSLFASIVAALCLAHLAPPAFSFRVDDPLDGVAIVAFLTTSLIISRLVSTVRKQVQEALSSVSYRVIEGEEKGRERIAKELHENIGQRLTMLVLEIEKLKRDPLAAVDTRRRMDAVLTQSLGILADVQATAHELSSPRLEYLGMAAVMSSFCRDFGAQKKMEIDFKSNGLPRVVPSAITLCLFRVLQEAVHNAAKHSGVRECAGRLWATSDEIHLTVSDCGVGFDPETARRGGGLGLNNMQERLKLVKGNLSIDSQPQRGTTIYACVPFSLGSDTTAQPDGDCRNTLFTLKE